MRGAGPWWVGVGAVGDHVQGDGWWARSRLDGDVVSNADCCAGQVGAKRPDSCAPVPPLTMPTSRSQFRRIYLPVGSLKQLKGLQHQRDAVTMPEAQRRARWAACFMALIVLQAFLTPAMAARPPGVSRERRVKGKGATGAVNFRSGPPPLPRPARAPCGSHTHAPLRLRCLAPCRPAEEAAAGERRADAGGTLPACAPAASRQRP